MATKQDESDTLNQFSEKEQQFIKEEKLMFIIQTDLPKNIYILAVYWSIILISRGLQDTLSID